jgi:hypothetical protein
MRKYKTAYSRLPSQLNLATLLNYKAIERRTEIDVMMRYTELIGIKLPRCHTPISKSSYTTQ